MVDNKTVDDLLEAANEVSGAAARSAPVTVQILDGPLAGRIQQVPAHVDRIVAAQRQPTTWVPETDQTVPIGHVTYRVKRSAFRSAGRTTPKWVAAIGDKVGDRVQCVQAYTHEARTGIHRFGELIERNARDQLARTCAEVGLVPTEVRKVFDGTHRFAESLVYPQWPDVGDTELQRAAEAVLRMPDAYQHGPEVSFVVYNAVAMPAPEPVVEPVTSWA